MRCFRSAVRCAPRLQQSSLLQGGLPRPLTGGWTSVTQPNLLFSTARASDERRHGVCRQYISLYNYTPLDKKKLPKLRRDMREQWGHLGVVGRIYLAEEGINAQLVVPEPHVTAFHQSFPRLLQQAKLFYGQLIADKPQVPRDDKTRKPVEPFGKLDIRVRDQILHDGFHGGHLDLQHSGHALSPDEWHRRLKERNDSHDGQTLVLDVRNFYEHEIGRFDGATRIMVDTFRDTFDALDEILAEHEATHAGEKPREVMMYCTGGIRCEKVGAYLTQYKGISNVNKLHGGIVNYMQFLKTQRQAAKAAAAEEDASAETELSLFKGKNFVFDQRCVGAASESEHVTADVLGQCFQCGDPCNSHTNCSNVMCGGLVLHCSTCAAFLLSACSEACKQQVVKMKSMTPPEQKEYRRQHAVNWMPRVPNALGKYISTRSGPLSSTQSMQTRQFTASRRLQKSIDDSELQTSYVCAQSTALSDGELLRELRSATERDWPKAEQLIDELQGKFLGFLVQSLRARRVLEVGCFTGYSALCLASGLPADGELVTCDVDAATMQFAQGFFDRSYRAKQIQAVHSDGLEYLQLLAAKTPHGQPEQFDLIFVDANKRKYRAYYDAILEHKLLSANGLLVFDNTLFRGRVAAYADGLGSKKERLARALAEFNAYVAQDARSTQVVMPLWDGLSLIRQA